MAKLVYDLFNYTSFPSSIKLLNDEDRTRGWWVIFKNVPVTPGSTVKAEIMGKSDNIPVPHVSGGASVGSYLSVGGSADGVNYRYLDFVVPRQTLYGKMDWTKHSYEMEIPPDVNFIRGQLVAAKGLTWFDDLKIYQDGVLIYKNPFNNWGPYISIPAPIVAGLGVIRFGKKG